jgi:two-component system NtrC family response regulator
MVNLDKLQNEFGFVVGRNPKMLRLMAAAKKIAKKNVTVLILGETGTGKEVLARYIHAISHRYSLPFWAFNCGAFTNNLLESELFGHEKGSFTGATGRKKGIFELAHKGTLFLDEIDTASQAIQIKLLRILETGEFIRIGGEELCKVDVRIISATNSNLERKVKEQKFREDLYYRLDVASLKIPPLRDRAEDIPLFINYFLEKETIGKGSPLKIINQEAMELLASYPWPGNIRELANTITQMVLLSGGPLITLADIPAKIKEKYPRIVTGRKKIVVPVIEKNIDLKPDPDYKNLFQSYPQQEKLLQLLQKFEKTVDSNLEIKKGFDFYSLQNDMKEWENLLLKRIIAQALEATYYNQVKAAKLLGITPRALRYYYKEKGTPDIVEED